MATEPPEPDNWCVLQTYADSTAAEADAGYLRSESVAAKVEIVRDIPGQDLGAQLMVDARLAHRARWLLKLATISEVELEYMATGQLRPAAVETAPAIRKRSLVIVALAVAVVIVFAILHMLGAVAIQRE